MLFVQGKLIPNRQKQNPVKAQRKNVSARPQTTQAGRRKVKQNHKQQRQRTFSPIPILEIKRQRHRTYSEIDREHAYWESVGFPEYMDEWFNDTLFDAYEWDKMDPKERWEQEQLNEFEGFAALEQLLLMQDEIEQQNEINTSEKIPKEEEEETNQVQLNEFEGFAALELKQLLLMQDEIEQENEINAIEKSLKEEQEEINQEQLTEIQLWDHADFVVQQLNQN
jgi:hypothetical protein